MLRRIATLASLFGLLGTTAIAAESPGFNEKEIFLGVSLPLSGSVSGIGEGLQQGLKTLFDKVNASGGIHGRKIVVKILDDAYEPEQSAKNAQELIAEENAFALFNFVGTPTSRAAVPLARKNGVPYLFPFTGAEFLRSPADPVIYNLRASYFDETETLVNHFVKDLGIKKIGIFAQGDAYGDAGLSGVVKALTKRGLKIVGEGRYKRNGSDIAAGYETIKKANPEAIILIGAYGPCAEFMKHAQGDKWAPKIANISFVGTENLINAAGSAGEGTFISQIMPSPHTSNLPIVQHFRKDMHGKHLAYTSLEAYVNASFMVDVLEKTGKDLSREKFLKTLESYSGEVGGLKAKFTTRSHQAFSKVYLTQIKHGKPVEVEKM